MATAVRRIVTGHHADGRSTVLIDGAAPNVKQRRAGNASTLLWVTDETPADVGMNRDRATREIGVPPPPGGSLLRITEFPPQAAGAIPPDNEIMLRDLGIAEGILRGHPPRHPAVHRTRTLDYVIVLEGEIDLLLDDGEVHLKAGDVVIQQATNHGWINRGATTCRLAMVFIDATEPEAIQKLSNNGDH